MPEPESDDPTTRRFPGELNGPQQNRLRITCHYIDKLLNDVEQILHQATSKSPFPRYIIDVSPAQVRVFEDYVRRLRGQLLRALDWQHMKPNPPDIPATRAVLTHLAFIDIAIEELRPSYMRGSGVVPEDAVDELSGVVHELRGLVEGMERYIRQELGTNLETRLKQLEQTGYDVALLRAIEEIVTRRGLVEFRPRIASLASRLEDDNLEVALFGRVSSGKSSLLNALLDTDVLPVGITPITAVPTRLRYGPELRAAVTYGDGRSEIVSVEQLADLVTEQGNPGNLRNVVRALVEVPSRRLKQGIVLVDTPGLGSLAKKGAAETLAYLPACDLALLLIDAGATLNEEDIGTLRLLNEAAIPSLVLLSKSDLLAEGDLHRAVSYIEEQIRHELGVGVHIHTVSSIPASSVLLTHFFERELLPRFEKARSLREASVARKIGALRDSVIAALETSLGQKKREKREPGLPLPDLEGELRLIAGSIGEMRTSLDHAWLEFGESPQTVLNQVTNRAVNAIQTNGGTSITALQLSEWIHDAVQEFLNQRVGQMRSAMQHAVETLRSVAQEMGSTEMPSSEEVDTILRDAPRFELAQLPDETSATRWKWMGQRVIRSALRNSLQRSVGPVLKDELHLYGHALSQWSYQALKKMEAVINSYADAYRVQIHRVNGLSEGIGDRVEVEKDLTLLRNWSPEENSDLAVKRA
jgi:GTP-binding protein EngB required for normal cell division